MGRTVGQESLYALQNAVKQLVVKICLAALNGTKAPKVLQWMLKTRKTPHASALRGWAKNFNGQLADAMRGSS
jgi:hypothetical protein